MNKEFKKDLLKASELKTVGKNIEALEFYEKCYQENPEAFTVKQKLDYAWTIYRVRIAHFKSEEELEESVEFITKLLPQKDLHTNPNCAYTSSVYKLISHYLHEQNYHGMLKWLEKINPELLDEKPYRKHGRLNKSKREVYYDWYSKAYLGDMQYERCIEVSKAALNEFKIFIDQGDTWHRWRIGKSLKELGRYREALDYIDEVLKVKHDWYMYRDAAESCFRIGGKFKSLDYLCPAMLSAESSHTKASIYYLAYNIFASFNPEIALKHAQLYYLLRLEKGYSIPYDIEKLDLDDDFKRSDLESEIRDLWMRYKFKDSKLYHGRISKFLEDKGYGFIESDGESIFFHRSEFCEEHVYVGQNVTFFKEDSYDSVRNEKSVKAVYVRGE